MGPREEETDDDHLSNDDVPSPPTPIFGLVLPPNKNHHLSLEEAAAAAVGGNNHRTIDTKEEEEDEGQGDDGEENIGVVVTSSSPPLLLPSSTYSFGGSILESFDRLHSIQNPPLLRTDPLNPQIHKRTIPGGLTTNMNMHLVAIYDEEHFAHKRPAATAVSSSSSSKEYDMTEPFDRTKFHFGKVDVKRELLQRVKLRCFRRRSRTTTEHEKEEEEEEVVVEVEEEEEEEEHNILVNISPLMRGHGLLVPWVDQCLPQVLLPEAIDLALDLLGKQQHCDGDACCEENYFRVGFNSLGAFSSVNHLHLHVLWPSEVMKKKHNTTTTKRQQQPLPSPTTTTSIDELGCCDGDEYDGGDCVGNSDDGGDMMEWGFPVELAPTLKVVVTSSSTTTTTTAASGGGDKTVVIVERLDWKVPCYSFGLLEVQQQEEESNYCCSHDDNIEDGSRNNRRGDEEEEEDYHHDDDDIRMLGCEVSRFVTYLHERRIPHNVLFTPFSRPTTTTTFTTTTTISQQQQCQQQYQRKYEPRIIIFPRKSQSTFDSTIAGYNAALGEIGGMIIANTYDKYVKFTQEDIQKIMECHVALDESLLLELEMELMKEYR